MEVTLSILNFEQAGGPITSPRSLEACLRVGFDPKDLLPRRLESFTHSFDRKRKLSPEESAVKYAHFESRRQEKINIVREEREGLIRNKANEEQTLYTSTDQAADVQARAAAIKSGMMEMEKRRIESVKKRQEKELQRIIENEKKMAELQKKLVQVQEEEVKRQKAHEKAVEEQRMQEIARKIARDHELARMAEEEEKKRREIARRDAEIKAKMLAEAKEAEKRRKKEAMERELDRIAKLEELRQRTEALIAEQIRKAEINRQIMEVREARVKAQMDEKKRKKAIEIIDNRAKAEKRIKDALDRNVEIQEKKKRDYDERVAAAHVRAGEKLVVVLEAVKKQAEDRKKKEDTRYKRLLDAGRVLRTRIQDVVDRAEGRSDFWKVVAAKREKEMLMRKQKKDLSLEDKLDNVQRIRNIDAFLRQTLIRKQEMDDERYERIKDEREYLIEQRKLTAQQSMIRKHRLKDAMEQMRVMNDFSALDQVLSGTEKKRRRGKGSASAPNLASPA